MMIESPTRTATIAAQISAKSSVLDDTGRVRMWVMVCMVLFFKISIHARLTVTALIQFTHRIKIPASRAFNLKTRDATVATSRRDSDWH